MNDLSDQTVMTFAGTAARGSAIPSPTEGMVTYRSDDNVVEVFDGSDFVGVGGGKILQVVSTTKTDTFTSSSTTFTTVTGLTASITPSSTSSKILVMAQIASSGASNTVSAHFKVTRGGTDVYRGDAAGDRTRAVYGGFQTANSEGMVFAYPITFLDSPSSTSALTYQVETRIGTSGSIAVNRSLQDTDNADRVRGASSITVMEVAG
jgi:hypothetical protein